jgi:O-antigen ligase
VARQKIAPVLFLHGTPPVLLLGAAYLPGLWPQPLGNALALVALGWALFVLAPRDRWSFPAAPLAGVALILWAFAGLLWSQNIGGTLLTLLHAGVAVFIFLAARQPGVLEPKHFFLYLSLLGAVRTTELLIHGALTAKGAAPPFWGSPNLTFAGLTAALGAVAALAGTRGSPPERRAAWVLPLLVGVVLYRGNMMGPLFALLLGVVVWFFIDRQKKTIMWGLPLFAIALLALFAFGPPWASNNPADPARWERLTIWKDTLRMIAERPWGGGLGTFEAFTREFQSLPGARVAPHAHNEYLEGFFELGLPGGFMALGLFGLAVARRVRDAFPPGGLTVEKKSERAVALGLLAVLLAAALVDFPLRALFPLLATAFVLALRPETPPRPIGRRIKNLLWVLAVAGAFGFVSSLANWDFHHRGKGALAAGDPARALLWFERAGRAWPWEPHLFYDQADCLVRMDRRAEAADRLTKSLRYSPRDIPNRRSLAKLTLTLEGPEAAARVYAPILGLAPAHAPYWREMGDLLAWAHRAEDSQRHYARAASLSGK